MIEPLRRAHAKKRKRYSTEQTVAAIKQHELGTPALEIIRKLGIAEQTFCRWKRRFRALTVIDLHTRECLAIEAGQRVTGEAVVEVLNRLRYCRGAPQRIYCDNDSEFSSRILNLWAYHNQVTLEFSRHGKPTDNGHIESFNGSLRDECLNAHWAEGP